MQTSEEEDVGEARSGQERGACIVADPLLGLSQRREVGLATLVPPTNRLTPTWKNPAGDDSSSPLASFSNNERQIMQLS